MARKKTAKKAEAETQTPEQIINSVNLAAKAREAGKDYALVYNRIKRGWSLEKALSHPVRKKKKSLSEQKAVVKKIHDTVKAAEIKETPIMIDDYKPNLEPPLISEKAEKSMGMLWLLVVVFVVAVVGVWLQEAGIIGWADRIVE
jgi:hypothetical protein